MVKMIDITQKEPVIRIAKAKGEIKLKKDTLKRIEEKNIEKGDLLSTSKLASIEAVKKVPYLLPLCHPIPLTNIDVEVETKEEKVVVRTKVKSIGKTGCEMEALTGTVVALLNIWDLTKTYEKNEEGQYPFTRIESVRVTKKVKKKIE